jgi:two-component system, chemotaxis family, CheB/CheR fusion protein
VADPRRRGLPLLNLDIGLPVDKVRPALRASMTGRNGTQTIAVGGDQPRGTTISCPGLAQPLVGGHDAIHGVIVVVEERADGGPA